MTQAEKLKTQAGSTASDWIDQAKELVKDTKNIRRY